jgi:PKD repeat protein
VLTKRFIVAVTAAAVVALGGACALDKQAAPGLAGPSELGLSLAVTASPDFITQDGFAQSVIEITARDASSQPVRGVQMRADIIVDGVFADFGRLSSRNVSTGTDGRAQVVYTAPPAVQGINEFSTVSVSITPIGTNFDNSQLRRVAIRLAPVGVILPPNGAPVANFSFSPLRPRENEETFFDASSSFDQDGQIVSYLWSFGDGTDGSGRFDSHAYAVAGDYRVTLTVTDNRGLSTSFMQTVPVQVAANPTAAFTSSPSNPDITDGTNKVFFNATGSTAPTGRTIVAYEWNFGNGNTGTGVTTDHTYNVPGTYTVTLKVTDNTGRSGVATSTITITQ